MSMFNNTVAMGHLYFGTLLENNKRDCVFYPSGAANDRMPSNWKAHHLALYVSETIKDGFSASTIQHTKEIAQQITHDSTYTVGIWSLEFYAIEFA